MARTAKQILMAQGYTEAELASSPILADARFVRAIEAEDAAIEARVNGLQTENTQFRETIDKTNKWYQETAIPTIEKTNRAAVAARAEAAQLKAQMQAETELGLRRVAEQENQPPANTPPANGGVNPATGEVDPRYVTSDTFQRTADQFGTALAMAADIPFDHQELFGTRLPGGVEGLRAGFQKARSTGFQGNMRDYWAQEFKVEAKRAERADNAKKEERARIESEVRAQLTSEMLNPHTRAPQNSRNPFATKKVAEGSSQFGKQPWETGTREQRASQRVAHFATKVLTEVNGRPA